MQYNMILYCGFYCVSKNLIKDLISFRRAGYGFAVSRKGEKNE